MVPVAGTPDASTLTDEPIATEDEDGATIAPGRRAAEGTDNDEGHTDGGDGVPEQYEITNATTGHTTRATLHDFRTQFKREGYELVGGEPNA